MNRDRVGKRKLFFHSFLTAKKNADPILHTENLSTSKREESNYSHDSRSSVARSTARNGIAIIQT
jgi:hypothetical protein